jgi:hypothetical protein
MRRGEWLTRPLSSPLLSLEEKVMSIEVGELYCKDNKYYLALSEDQFVYFTEGIWKVISLDRGFKIRKVADLREAAELLEVSMKEFNKMSEMFFRLDHVRSMNVSSKCLVPVREPNGKFHK